MLLTVIPYPLYHFTNTHVTLYTTFIRHFLPQKKIWSPVRTGSEWSRLISILCSPMTLCDQAMTSAQPCNTRSTEVTRYLVLHSNTLDETRDLNPLLTAVFPCCRSASIECFPTHSMSSTGRLTWYIYESTSFHRQHSIVQQMLVHSLTIIEPRKGHMTLLPYTQVVT